MYLEISTTGVLFLQNPLFLVYMTDNFAQRKGEKEENNIAKSLLSYITLALMALANNFVFLISAVIKKPSFLP
jgi:hypothetical protein